MNYVKAVAESTGIAEGETAVEAFLITVYLEQPLANKTVSKKLFLPIPLVSAMKREFMKHGLMMQQGGICLTEKGQTYLKEMGFKNLNKTLYRKAIGPGYELNMFDELYPMMAEIFAGRPVADRSVDQAHCTLETSLKRSLLAIKNHCLINKKILCVGDDDLVSIALGILLKVLKVETGTEIHVIDEDQRLIDYIETVASDLALPIICHRMDLREPMEDHLKGNFDSFFTDPPYTLTGLKLFMSRGIEALNKRIGNTICLSFGHKSYDMSHKMMRLFYDSGLVIKEVMTGFNTYEGAAILGNTSQMLILKTSNQIQSVIDGRAYFEEPIYTRAVKNTKNVNEKGEYNDTRQSI